MKRFALLALLALAPASAGAATVVLSPTADAWIDRGDPTANHGADPDLVVMRSGGNERRALLRFDVTSLPPGVVIAEAYLALRVTQVEVNAFPVEVQPIRAAWSEGTVTWSNGEFLHDSTTVVGGYVPSTPIDLRCDVTSLVREWVTGTRPAYGLLLRAAAGSGKSGVASREAGALPARPVLVVETATEVPSTTAKVASGKYVGTGFAGLTVTGLGFAPDVVLVRGTGQEEAVLRTSAMTGDVSKGLEKGESAFAGGIQSLDADGFTLGADRRVNESGQVHYWTAFRAEPGRLAVGRYAGNAQDFRAIPTGFAPRYVVVLDDGTHVAMQRFLSEVGDRSLPFKNDVEHNDRIQAFLADGFEVGKAGEVNANGDDYYYIAWPLANGGASSGGYQGDGLDNRDIRGVAFAPELLFVKSSQGERAALRTSAVPGDLTLPATSDPPYADGIQALWPDGFQVGTRKEVNELGRAIHWAAFGRPAFTDLGVSASVSDATPAEGDSLAWTSVVRNEGPVAASSVVVTQVLPPGVTYLAHGQSRGAYSPATGAWQVGTLAPGDSAKLVIGTRVDVGRAGTHIVDWVDVTATDRPDSVRWNQAGAAAIDVTPLPAVDLLVAKSVDQPAPSAGQLVVFTVAVKNQGDRDATAVTVTDLLPVGLTYLWDLPSRGTYAYGNGQWNVGALAAGNSATLQLAATVDLGTGGQTLVNRAALTGVAQGDIDPSNDADSVAVVVQSADLHVAVGVSDANPSEGGAITFSVLVKNEGPLSATGVALDDVLPAGLAFVSATPSVGSYANATGRWTVGGVALGDSATLQLVATVDAGTAGATLVNTAAVSASDQPDPDPADDSASIAFVVQSASLAVTTDVDDPAPREGDVVRLSVVVANAGPNAADVVQLQDLLPAGLSWVSHSSTAGVYNPPTGRWDVGALAVGAAESLDVFASVDAGTGGRTIWNVASRAASHPGDPTLADDVDSVAVVVRSADLAVTKTPSLPYADEGGTLIWTLAVSNTGPFDAASVAVADTLPPTLTWLADTPSRGSYDRVTGVWTVGPLAAHETATLAILTRVAAGAAGTTITNIARSSGSDLPDPNPANDAWTADVHVRAADLTLTKTVNRPNPVVGQTVTYTLMLINDGPDAATGVAVADSLPAGVTYVSQSANRGTYNPVTGIWSIGTIPDSSFARLSLSATVDFGTQGRTLENIARVSAVDEADPFPGGEADTASITVSLILPLLFADLEITKGVDIPAPREGDRVRFSVDVKNRGPNPATGVEATDLLPAGLSFISAATTRGTYAPGTGRWTIGPLGLGESVALDIDATVDAGTAGSAIKNVASVTGSDLPDPVPSNDMTSASILVQSADLAIAAGVDNAAPDEGDVVTFAITLANGGPDGAGGLVVSSPLAPSLSFFSAAPTQGVYVDSTGAWNVGTLAPGGSARLDLAATVGTGSAGSTLVQSATVTASDQGDPAPANDTASVSVTVRSADVALSKSVNDPSPAEGDSVRFTISASNLGPDPAEALVVADALPAGLSYAADSASAGTYDSGTGAWSIGDLGAGTTATLSLSAVVAEGTAASTVTNVAARAGADVADPNAANDAASAAVTVRPFEGITITALQDSVPAHPGRIDVRLLTIALANGGASTVQVQSLTFHNATVGPGTPLQLDADFEASVLYRDDGDLVFETTHDVPLDAADVAGGALSFSGFSVAIAPGAMAAFHVAGGPSLAARDGDILDLRIDAPGNIGLDVATAFGTTFPIDPAGGIPVDGMVAAQIRVQPVPDSDLPQGTSRALAFGFDAPSNGYEADVVSELHLSNLGDAVAADLTALELWADGGDDVWNGGSGDDVLLGAATAGLRGPVWSLTGLNVGVPVGGRRLFATVSAAANATIGRSVLLALPSPDGIVVASGNSGPVDVPRSASGTLTISEARSVVVATTRPQTSHALRPGAAAETVFKLVLRNMSPSAETLVALTVQNATTGSGSATVADLDADWQPLSLVRNANDDSTGEPLLRSSATFAGGLATFALSQTIAPGDSAVFDVLGAASLAARDGDLLDLRVVAASSLSFLGDVDVTGSFPLSPSGSYAVDGLVAEQIALAPGAPSLSTGDKRRLALDAVLPANGYESDVLTRFDVVNLGTAQPLADLERVEAWVDDGDGTFAPSVDRPLGDMAYTGVRWEITGLAETVPEPAGLRVFVSVDVADLATAGRTVELAFPGPPEWGVGMISADDGPIDHAAGTAPQTITTVDRVTLTPGSIAAGDVSPGAVDVALFDIQAANSYAATRTLTLLRLRNATTGSGTVPELDAELHRLVLRADDGDGIAEAGADSVLGVAFLSNGEAVFSGLDFALAPGETRRLFVLGDVSTAFAADGDVLAVEVSSESDVAFLEPTATAAGWPLDSGGRWTVNGMVAAQMRLNATPAATLGPNEGPALALDVVVPGRGYDGDVLERLSVQNLGTATPADLAEIRLWRDGGDGSFDAGASDDADLGTLAPFGGVWTHPALSETLPASGARFFLGVRAAASPGDSTTVRLAVPTDGLQVGSDNDGPLDVPVGGAGTVLLSTAVLLASLEIDPAASTIDSTVSVTMTVRNVHPTTAIENVTPSALVASGLGGLQLVLGPTPASRTLAPGESGTFSWVYRATSSGDVRLAGWADGTEEGSGAPHRSLTVASNEHHVFLHAQDLDLYAVESMPFSINRGQTGVVPISLTFENPAGPGGSDIRVTALRIGLEDESGSGIVPADLLARVVVSEGAVIYAERASLETSGAEVDLAFAQTLLVESSGASSQATVSIAFDISPTTTVPTFRVKIVDASWIVAEDATSGGPVSVTLRHPDDFPIASGLARVVAEAVRLDVDAAAAAPITAGRGQDAVPLLALTLQSPDPSGLAADVRVPSFEVRLLDSTGAAVSAPMNWLDALRVDSGPVVHLDRALTALDDSTISLAFAPLVSIPVNTPLTLTLRGDVSAAAPLGRMRLALADSATFDARDANTGAHVPVVFATLPLPGPWITLQASADSLVAAGLALMPAVVDVGAADVTAMRVVLTHPGAPGAASARIESLALQCREGSGAPLAPATYLDRVRVLRAGTEVGLVTNLPPAGDVVIPLGGVVVDAGGSVALDVVFDAEITAPPSVLGLGVPAGGIVARDANLDTPVAISAPAGGFPLLSGFAQLRLPAREIVAGFEDRMPAVLAADGRSVDVAKVTLRNPAPATAGEIRVTHLDLRAADRDLVPIDLGVVASSASARIAGAVWAASGELDPSLSSSALVAADTLVIAPGESIDLVLEITLRNGVSIPSLRIGLDAEDVGLVHPPGGPLGVSVLPAAGQSLPFWTQPGNFSQASLAESWSNFPNPFAAGREHTTLVFYMPQDGRVSLKLWTLRGEEVRTLLDGAPFAAGLHQDTVWDGRNGRGEVVRNGVYLAEIRVSYGDGSSDSLRRKVAVLR